MEEQLDINDFEFILTSLEYTRLKFENTQYPAYELKQSQLERVNSVMKKIRNLKNKLEIGYYSA